MPDSANLKIDVAFICNRYLLDKIEEERALGEFLEDELHKRGIIPKLPSFTDWGYVF